MAMENSFFVIQVAIAARNVSERKLDRNTAWANFAMSLRSLSAEQVVALKEFFDNCLALIDSNLAPSGHR